MSKSAEAFRTISEVAEVLDTPAHVLRFWESRFSQIRPVKRAGGRRYYRPSDIALLAGIRRLLHEDGLTIRGVQKILREKGVRHVAGLSGRPYEDAQDGEAEAAAGAGPTVPSGARTAPERRGGGLAAMPLRQAPTGPSPHAESLPGLFEQTEAPEAPMLVDAEPAAEAGAVQATPFRQPAGGGPAPGAGTPDSEPAPVAALLRAMDAVRARSKREELARVRDRLTALRDRLSRLG